MQAIQQSRQISAFSLIELMIVIAIIGILATMGIPAYQDYMARARVAEVLVALNNIKTGVSEFVMSRTLDFATPRYPASLAEAGISDPSAVAVPSTPTAPNKIQTIVLGTATGAPAGALAGAISATVNAAACGFSPNSLTLTLTLNPTVSTTGSISWACMSTGTGTKYAPSSCSRP